MKRKLVAVLCSVTFVAVAFFVTACAQTADNATKTEVVEPQTETTEAPPEITIKPTDVVIPASLQEAYDATDRSENCDPTPGYQGKSALAKLNEHILDVESGYECQIAGLRDPFKDLPDERSFGDAYADLKSGILGVSGNPSTDGNISIYLENLDDAELLYARFLIGLTADEIASLPPDPITFKLSKTRATIDDLWNAERIVNDLGVGEMFGIDGELGVYDVTTWKTPVDNILDNLPASDEKYKKFIKLTYDPDSEIVFA
ncbi:MAG: hypothetical protein LBL41_05220 [Bifidobacteriaceae bacterium]|jgi:hypothetical protein|nr:hypothetical protein [Bifidobacteriaceae bacterium]